MKRCRIDIHRIEPILCVKRLVEIEPNRVRSGDGTDEPSASRHRRITAVHDECQWNLRMRNWIALRIRSTQWRTDISRNPSPLRSGLASTSGRCHESGTCKSKCNPRCNMRHAKVSSPACADGKWRVRNDCRSRRGGGRGRRQQVGAVVQRESHSRQVSWQTWH